MSNETLYRSPKPQPRAFASRPGANAQQED